MKSFKQYLAEAVKEIPVRIKLATDVNDDMVDCIEAELQRYDVVSVGNPTKTIMQEHPLDFGTKIKNAEVFIIDAVVRMPMSFETFRRNLSDKLAIPYDYVVVKGENDPLEGENELEVKRNTANPEDYETKIGQDYTDEESKVEGDHFGEKHKENFLKTLADNKEKDPDRAEVEVEGPLSMKRAEGEKDTSQPKEVDPKAKSPLSQDNRPANNYRK
jgi:hypothetical protein